MVNSFWNNALLFTLLFIISGGHSACIFTDGKTSPKEGDVLVVSFSQTPGVGAPGEVFSSTLFDVGGSEVPKIGEWTRTGGPDETLVLTGHKLSSFSGEEEGKDIRFMVYGSGGVKKEAQVQRLDGDKAIITLDPTLPSWSMYLLQPGNDAGWGKAVAINKTEAWWAQNRVSAGMTASLYGRNLAHGNIEGTSNSHVYIKSLGAGSGQWAQVVKVNPYKLEYKVPSSLSSGQYELWVHNGHGGELGWSAPLLVTVVGSNEHIQTKAWSSTTINVRDYGARGDGQSDDRTAINQALLAADSKGATVYFPSGTYMVSGQLNLRSNTRWLGDVNAEGKPVSIIKLRAGFAGGEFGLMGGSNISLVLFKNLVIDRNYQSLGGKELMDFRSGSMLWWDNCDLEVRQENVLRLAGSCRHIYISGTTITGGRDQWDSPLFLDGVRQFFLKGSTIRMTRDCGAAINNKAVVESSMEDCVVKDLDNSTTDGSGWGKGRIWSHIGAGGAAYHCYFAGNTGTGLGTRESGTNIPDGNSGEVFLWEANGTYYSGVPSSSSAGSVSFGSGIPQDRGELCLAIIKGKGFGQFRRIVSNNGGTLTLDRPWEVQPDGSSIIVVGPYVEKIVLYKNKLDAKGKSYIANNGMDKATASAGIEPYGGCFDFVADGNTIEGLRKGLSTWATEHGTSIDPTYFCLYTNNKMIGCRVGIHHAGDVTTTNGMAMLGITYRHNLVQSPILSAIHSDLKVENRAVLSAIVYEHNSYSNSPSVFTTGFLGNPDPRANFGAGGMENQVFYKNSFIGGGNGIKITPKIVLRENNYR